MSAPATRRSSFESWSVLLVAFVVLTIGFSLGRFALPVFYPVLIKRFGWGSAATAAGGSIMLLLIGVLGPLVGWLADKYTPKLVLLGGASLTALSLVLLSAIQNLTEWYLYCVLLGLGIAAVSLVPASMLIAPWFSRKRGLAVGVINAGVGVGGYIAPRLTPVLIRRYGASEAFLYLAMFLAIPFLVTLFLARGARTPGGAHSRTDFSSAGQVARMPLFWMFGISLFFAAHTLTGVQEHLVLYLTRQGRDLAGAGLALSTLLGASAFGKVLGGAAADRYSSRVSLLLSVACLMLAIGGLLTVDPRSSLIYWVAAVFGLGFGGVFNAPSIIAFEHFGTERVGTILGLFMMFFGVGTSTGGLVSGAVYDRTQQYSASFVVDLTSAVIAFLLLLVLGSVRIARPAPIAAQLEKKIA